MDVVEYKAQTFAQKVRHYLITTLGRTADEATHEEFYRAFCVSLREEIMINWTATMHTFKKKKTRMLYYLSMEYMPGRLFVNNITNISAVDLVKQVLKILGRDFETVVKMESDIGIGNGGLGRLASCFLDSLATLQYPAFAYGMRYHYGIFEQELICGVQLERPDCWLLTENPWEFRRDSHAVPVSFAGKLIERQNSHGDKVYDLIDYEEVRALPYDLPIIGFSHLPNFSVLTLRLWSTKESPRNFQLQRYNAGEFGKASENTSLTDVLYPNDNHEAGKRIRLKQEFLLVSASLQDILCHYFESHETFHAFPDKVRIQINDTHPSLVIPELMRILTKEYDIPFDNAWDVTRTCCSYTNHTVLKEALEEWNTLRMQELLPRQFNIIQKLNERFCHQIKEKFPNDETKLRRMSMLEEGQVKMAHLAIYGSHKVNGVAKLHTEILKSSLFKDFYDFDSTKFVNITNGVTQRRWLLSCNPKLAHFIDQRIGRKWITDFEQIKKLADYAQDKEAQKEFLSIKRENKTRLLNMIREDLQARHGISERFIAENILGEEALFDVQVKRIHEYKRQLMKALHLLMLYFEIKEQKTSHRIKRFVIFGGKAAPGYVLAKNIIRFIYCLGRKINRDKEMQEHLKVFFVENYNVSKAEIIIPATDLSEQISTAGMEASGTGNMKFSINGALTICTDDGANVEMRKNIGDKKWPFLFGATAEENDKMRQKHHYNPLSWYTNDAKIRRVMDALIDGSLVENEMEEKALKNVHESLMKGAPGVIADRFFVLNDLLSYYETQKKVEELYFDPMKWAEYALYNIAGMGSFSADISIQNYAQLIWGLEKCPCDEDELKVVRQEYSEHDRCRIIPDT